MQKSGIFCFDRTGKQDRSYPVNLVNQTNTMNQETQLLAGYSDLEKGAYLGAIATMATADREATQEEITFLDALAEAAQLSDTQKGAVLQAAKDPSNISLEKCLETLKNSDLRFSLITDIISFAKSDGKYSPEEESRIAEMASQLNVNNEQVQALSQFVQAAEQTPNPTPEAVQNNLLGSGGIGDMLKRTGIPTNGLMRGLLSILAPIVLSRILSGRGRSAGAGGFGGLGGLLGGQSMPARQPMGGGLGSIISILSGGRGYRNTAGGLLGRVLAGNNRF
jgi:uncharacterized tellurite resistance protein B-like protein